MGSTTKSIWSYIQFLVFHGAGRHAVEQKNAALLLLFTLLQIEKYVNTCTANSLVPFQIVNVRFSNSVVVELARLINADQGLPLQFFDVRAKIRHELFETALEY
jgi:hypothetical protein